MAKKRRRSKWVKRTKERLKVKQRWVEVMEDEELQYRIFRAIENTEDPYNGAFLAIGKTLKYCLLDDEENLIEYEVAVLTDEGVFIYDTPYSDDEAPF